MQFFSFFPHFRKPKFAYSRSFLYLCTRFPNLPVWPAYIAKSDWRETNERESKRCNHVLKSEARPIQTLQNPPRLRHRRLPQTTLASTIHGRSTHPLWGSPHRRFSVSRPLSACGHVRPRVRHFVYCVRIIFGHSQTRRPARFVLNATKKQQRHLCRC